MQGMGKYVEHFVDQVNKWQTHLGIQAFFPLELGGPTWADGVLSPRVDWSYQSEMSLIGPEVESALQTGYNLLNARLSYTFWDDQLMVALWTQNLLDENRFDSVTPIISSYGVTTRFFQMPRTYGGEIRYSF